MLVAFVALTLAAAVGYRRVAKSLRNTGDPRYDHDGIGKIVRLFQIITFTAKPATKFPRTQYVETLRRYIANFNKHADPIVGDSHRIKATVYKRMTEADDYELFNRISSTMILIANNERSLLEAITIVALILRSGVFNYNELIMKISLSATLCTLLCLPDPKPDSADAGVDDAGAGDGGDWVELEDGGSGKPGAGTAPAEDPATLKGKAAHYRLIRFRGDNPFVGITACPMLRLWDTIALPPIINTDDPASLGLRGGAIRYLEADAAGKAPTPATAEGNAAPTATTTTTTATATTTAPTATMATRLEATVAYVRANAFVAAVPFFLDLSVSPTKALNALTYLLGFETWNQFDSGEEDAGNGKARPPVDRRITLAVWVMCLLVSEWPVRVWLLLCPGVYLAGNSTPLKEALMCVGIYVHYHYLGLPIHLASILRHALTGCVQDVRDVDGDRRSGRTTLPMLVPFQACYACLALAFAWLDPTMPLHSLAVYLVVALLAPRHPRFSYVVWQANYVAELFFRCRTVAA